MQGRGRLTSGDLARTRRSAGLFALAAVVILAVVAHRVMAVGSITLYVDDNSPCSTGCGSQASPYRAIQPAIVDANTQIGGGQATGATILVADGNYLER